MSRGSLEVRLQGTPICRGVSIGKPVVFLPTPDVIPEITIDDDNLELEVNRYRDALVQSRQELESLQKDFEKDQFQEGVQILGAQLQMTYDPMLTTHIEHAICSTHKNAEFVLQSFIEEYETKFKTIEDPFFQDRFRDIQDIHRRVMGYLRSKQRLSLANIPPDSIIFARALTAADTAEANSASASALVTELGGPASHAAIVAKAKGTPYVSSIAFQDIDPTEHNLVIVDGRTGDVILSPSKDTLKKYRDVRNKLLMQMENLVDVKNLASETYDGYSVRLSANIEMASELDLLHQHGGSGVGLFRSEYIFRDNDRFPTEEEQFVIYRELVEKMRGLPIVIRTFDVGGDKGSPLQKDFHEENPFLGCRAIRFLLKERDIFKTQLRAVLRASVFGDVSIMFPMVSTLSELIEAKNMIFEVQAELEKEKQKCGRVRIGCMIEVPSAAIIADLLAKECDFLSIGTNDLVQYALAVDRSNHQMSSLYTPTHPSVLRLIKIIVHEAANQGIPVAICGEVAADPRFTPLLLGLGIHELSVSARYLPAVKQAIRNTSIVEASQLAERALTLTSAGEIQELLTSEYKKNAPDDCFYNY